MLKCGWHIAKTHWHHFKLIQRAIRGESCLWFIRLVKFHLPISGREINSTEYRWTSKSILGVICSMQWMRIFNGDRIKIPIVYAKMPSTIFFSHHYDRCNPGGLTDFHKAFFHHVVHLWLNHLQSLRRCGFEFLPTSYNSYNITDINR